MFADVHGLFVRCLFAEFRCFLCGFVWLVFITAVRVCVLYFSFWRAFIVYVWLFLLVLIVCLFFYGCFDVFQCVLYVLLLTFIVFCTCLFVADFHYFFGRFFVLLILTVCDARVCCLLFFHYVRCTVVC